MLIKGVAGGARSSAETAMTHSGPLYIRDFIESKPDKDWLNNRFSPARRQAISWTNADLLSIVPSGTNFNEI